MNTMLSRVSKKGQVTLPIEARRALGIKPRDQVQFKLEDGRLILQTAASALAAIYRSIPALERRLPDKDLIRIAAEEHEEHVAREGLP